MNLIESPRAKPKTKSDIAVCNGCIVVRNTLSRDADADRCCEETSGFGTYRYCCGAVAAAPTGLL